MTEQINYRNKNSRCKVFRRMYGNMLNVFEKRVKNPRDIEIDEIVEMIEGKRDILYYDNLRGRFIKIPRLIGR